jgi:hypothetical protein
MIPLLFIDQGNKDNIPQGKDHNAQSHGGIELVLRSAYLK